MGGKHKHAENLHIFIREVMDAASYSFDDLDAIAVSIGPGSYTGLRIGVSATKGLAFAKNIPVIAVNTLEALAAGFSLQVLSAKHTREKVLLLPMIDARRMEVYCAGFDGDGVVVFHTRAEILSEASFPEAAGYDKVFFFGDGASKCIDLFDDRKAFQFTADIHPSAPYMISLAEHAFTKGKFQNTAYFEPFYLKDFLVGRPKST